MITWQCPRCAAAARTVDDKIPMHQCPGLRGLMVPLVAEGTKVEHRVVEREDYIGDDLVQLDDSGRPVMAVVTQHEDGHEDRTVYAPTATVVRG